MPLFGPLRCIPAEFQGHHAKQSYNLQDTPADVLFIAQQESLYFFTELAASREHSVMPEVRI
jgi:hypothetical protein